MSRGKMIDVETPPGLKEQAHGYAVIDDGGTCWATFPLDSTGRQWAEKFAKEYGSASNGKRVVEFRRLP